MAEEQAFCKRLVKAHLDRVARLGIRLIPFRAFLWILGGFALSDSASESRVGVSGTRILATCPTLYGLF